MLIVDDTSLHLFSTWFVDQHGRPPNTYAELAAFLRQEHARGDFPDWPALRAIDDLAKRH